jgi:multisubunit Na+/H+ antiporter MnhB subunit
VVVARAVALRYDTLGAARAERSLPVLRYAPAVAVSGLLFALAIGFFPVILGEPPLTHYPRAGDPVAEIGTLELTTAVAFDVGVFLLVAGSLVELIHQLARLVEEPRA